MSAPLYMVKVDIVPQKDGIDLARYIQKIHHCLAGYHNASKVMHRFKVTGEATMIAIFEVSNVIGLERTVAGLWRLGGVSVTCQPLLPYEAFAQFLGVETELLQDPNIPLPDDNLYWLEVTVTHPGTSIDSLLKIWKDEATTVLSFRLNDKGPMKIFKETAQKKVHLFLQSPSQEHLDQLVLGLPIVKALGDGVRVQCRALQNLETLQARILNEVL